MTLKIQPVDINYVNQVWHLVEPFIDEALQKGEPGFDHNYATSHVQVFLTTGAWLLIVAVDEQNVIQGAGTVSFLNYPLHRVAFITSVGGKFMINEDTFAKFSAIVKQRGATKVQGFTRDSMARLSAKCGFKPVNTLIEVKI